jgi:hypothetical protein
MEQKINIAELLKECPVGMELDCTMFGGVEFDGIVDNKYTPIRCRIKNPDGGYNVYFFTKHGYWNDDCKAKCVIFPKGETSWEGFVPPCKFEDGDMVATENGLWIGITTGGQSSEAIPTYCVITRDGKFEAYLNNKVNWRFDRLATEAEKVKLFQAIRVNGFNWNPESKTLNKLIEPKFKVGDRIRHKILNKNDIYEISRVYDDSYGIVGFTWMIYMKYQDNYELVPNHKFKVGDKITYRDIVYTIVGIDGDYYSVKSIIGEIGLLPTFSENAYDLIPKKFDISSLKPFESKVLVRTDNRKWVAAFYSHYDKDASLHYCVVGGLWYEQCIPYKGNEHLLNTTDNCDEYYKNW